MALMAAAVFSAAAAVAVFALAFTLYALVEPTLGRAGAAGTVAGVTALLIALGGVLLILSGRKPPPKPPVLTGNLLERALAFVRQRPVLAASAAIGAGFMAVRDPKYLGEVLRTFLGESDGARRKR